MTRYKSSAFVKYLATVAAVIGASTIAQADEGTKFGGFVDAGYTYNGEDGVDAMRVRDGAFYMNHNAGNSSFTFDLPFSVSNGSNDFAIGKNRGQAFMKHTYASGMGWRFGQFDGIFGLERNDRVNVFFADQGALYSTQAKTHLALEGSYAISDSLSAQLYVGGAHSQGGANSENRPEVGARVSLGGDYKIAVGGSFRKVADDTSMIYGNVTAEGSLMGVGLGIEASVQKAGEGDMALGGGVTATYAVMGDMEAGVRAQYLSKFEAHQQLQGTAGVRYKMTKNINAKLNYVFDQTTQNEGGEGATTHSGVLAATFGF